jgi:8-oxo-dGTP diphosphatase
MGELDAGARPGATVGWLFVDDEGGVLLVEPLDASTWEIPGGRVERGETPTEAGQRLLAETLGLELTAGGLLVADTGTDGAGYVLDGGSLTDAQLDAIELSDALESWAYLPPDELFVMMAPALARRVTAALEARSSGATAQLDQGTAGS